jgi:hypothetical protein
MAYAANHQFTRPAPRDPADEYVHDPLFAQDRRYNALTINPPANSYVRTVTDDPDDQFDDAVRAAGADLLGGQYLYARAGFVRRAVRPVSRAEGRGRRR